MTAAVTRSDPPSASPPERGAIARHRWTVADYYRLADAGVFGEDSRIELLDGEVVDMAPIGSTHAYSLDKLARALYRTLGERFLIRVQNPIHLDEYSDPQPDLVVALDRDYSAGHPQAKDILLVVEVADTSLVYDRDVKIPLYARHGIPQAWLLETNGKRLTVYREPVDGCYRQSATLETGDTAEIGDVKLSASEILLR